MKISDIIYREEILLSLCDENLTFNKIATSIQEVTEDSVLIIPNGAKVTDNTVYKVAPVAIICDNSCPVPEGVPHIRVKDPRSALSWACYRYEEIDRIDLRLIGITGTNGKSSTSMFIKNILSFCGHRVGYIGTGKIEIDDMTVTPPHYSMTTPDPPLLYRSLRQMYDKGCDTVVMEVSSHALALNKVDPLIFDYGVFTNISQEHLDFHHSFENYLMTKSKLFERCKTAVFNIDDPYGRRLYKQTKCRKLSAGVIWRGDNWVTNINKRGLYGTDYLCYTKSSSTKIDLRLAGIHNVYNSLLAFTVCADIGCKPCEIKNALSEIKSLPGRLEIIKDKITVIIDYAHTDSAFNGVMKELFLSKGKNRLTVIFGCGGCRDKLKRPKMAGIAEKYADRIIVTTDNSREEDPKDIISDILRGFSCGSFEVIENRRDAIRAGILFSQDDDIVAIIGKGPEKYNIDKNGYSDFNENEIIKTALVERRSIK